MSSSLPYSGSLIYSGQRLVKNKKARLGGIAIHMYHACPLRSPPPPRARLRPPVFEPRHSSYVGVNTGSIFNLIGNTAGRTGEAEAEASSSKKNV